MVNLDADEMNRLMIDAAMGRAPSVPGDEAKAFYDRVLVDIAAKKAAGIMPMPIPD